MKFTLLIFLVLFAGCGAKKSSNYETAYSKLHGRWVSSIIRSKEPEPPKKIVLEITTYNKTKLVYMKMIATGEGGQTFDKTIRISLDKKGYIIPSIQKELKSSPKTFIWYNPKHKEAIKGLGWKYIITENELTIEMGLSRIMFRRDD